MAETTGARQARTGGWENESPTRERISNFSENIKDKISDMSQRVNDAIDEQRNAAASKLDDTASTLHDAAGKMTRMAHRAADTLEQTSQYIREHDSSAMMEDVVHFVKRYPTQAIVGAAVAGFLVGRLFRRG
jgi:ElaB/YqjD/DUF883 family membrane-anchored ribosome-binding protein